MPLSGSEGYSRCRGRTNQRRLSSSVYCAGVTRQPRRHSSLLINSDADEVIVAQLFDVARFIFDLVGLRIRPLVVDPAALLRFQEVDHLADQILAILILDI